MRELTANPLIKLVTHSQHVVLVNQPWFIPTCQLNK